MPTDDDPAVPSGNAAPGDGATFSLEATASNPAWNRPWGNLRRLRRAAARRFAFFGVGSVLVTGGAAALFYGARAAGWWLTLFAGVVLVARAVHLWSRRPFLHMDARGLAFRLTPSAQKHDVRWDELDRLDADMTGARLHRTGDAPTMHLAFDALPADSARQLTEHLADTARAHGVPVYPTGRFPA